MRILLPALLVLILVNLSAQQISKSLFSSTGGHNIATDSGSSLQWSLGELVTSRLASSNVLTQGFNQLDVRTTPIYEWNEGGIRIDIFPNPFTDQITIRQKENNSYKIEIHDMLGRLIHQDRLDSPTNSIDLSTISDQNLLLTISSPQVRKRFKIIKLAH